MKPIPIEPSFAAWRRVARSLLQAAVEPHEIEWIECIDVTVPAWNENKNIPPAVSAETPVPEFKISRELLSALEAAAWFRAPDRWSLLYRILWRWSHGERAARSPEDPDGALLDERIKAVEREAHEMETRTRFRRRDPSLGPPELVGWYEPRHDVLERTAARLAKRTGYATWVVATPHGAAFWDGTLLRVARPAEEGTPSRTVSDGPVGEADTGDAPEALWLAHYAHAFARGSGRPHAAAQPVVPLRYWKAPPEGLPAAPRRAAPRRARDHAQAVTVEAEPEDERHRVSVLTALPLRAPPATLAACKRCGLWRNATQAVAGVGPAPAALMLVGEQPGKQDDRDGQPFSGPAGQLLDEVLARAGLDHASLYLTHAVKHFKWESQGRRRLHRTPASREIDACHHWLEVELAEVAPRVVVTLGATALKALTGPHISLSEYLGQTIAHEGRLIVPTYHPSYALRAPDTGLRDEIVATLVAALARAAALAREPLPSRG